MKKKKNKEFNHKVLEEKWQKKWSKEGVYYPKDMTDSKDKFYNLWMFPYPSAEGLHAGHAFASTGSDIFGRFMRMNGKRVFQPIGYDSFGLHSENFALKRGKHPGKLIEKTTKHYEKQLKSLGHAYDWTRTVTTSDISYYKWTQWLFIEMFKAGLAYRKKSEVNWCPSCKTVIADEQVMTPAQAGKKPKDSEGGVVEIEEGMVVCERCGTLVEKRKLSQWHFRITDYAERLLSQLERIDWPSRIKNAQRNWIGKSKGALIDFEIVGENTTMEVFTTRPDTLYGATFMVVAPEYAKEKLKNHLSSDKRINVLDYIRSVTSNSFKNKNRANEEKTGVDSGLLVTNPATEKNIPVYVSDYVLMEYGTGAIMGVPAHDQRDWEFAKKHGIEITSVIAGGGVGSQAYDGKGEIINSGDWNGMVYPGDFDKVIEDLENKGWGEGKITYHLRDWIISRQRYWGPPIPMIYCKYCAKQGNGWFEKSKDKRKSKLIHANQDDWDHAGWYPVGESDLPVELPDLKDYRPKGRGKGPLADHPEFFEVDCPVCGKKAKRETDVSDTFLDSAWYFLAYPLVGTKIWEKNSTPGSAEKVFDNEIVDSWLPVDLYFGGAEHAVLHLMYARFITMVLSDLKYINFDEPFPNFFAHGLMIKDGSKMSKSRGNVVNPDEYIEKYGADTLRLYLMFMGPMDGYPDFRDTGIEGMRRFVDRLWRLFVEHHDNVYVGEKQARQLITKMHQTIKKVTRDIQSYSYNTAIAALMEYVNLLREIAQTGSRKVKGKKVRCAQWSEALSNLALLLAPFAPHIAEEVWKKFNSGSKKATLASIHLHPWPEYIGKLTKEKTLTIPIQVNGKLRSTIRIGRSRAMDKSYVLEKARKDKKIGRWLKGKKIKKEIFIPARLVNLVV